MFNLPIVQALEALCGAAASANGEPKRGYQPTKKQIFFFVVVWCEKNRKPAQTLEAVIELALRDGSAQIRVAAVANHLSLWGEAVSGLQQKSAREWLVLGKQMERRVKRYNLDSGLKEDAVQNAQIKVWQNLTKIPSPSEIEADANLLELLTENQAHFTNIYDFGSPIYNWAKRVASNELGMTIRADKQNPGLTSIEEWLQNSSDMQGVDDASSDDTVRDGAFVNGASIDNALTVDLFEDEDEADSRQAMILQLTIDLTRLLDSIESELTRTQRQVIIYTLSVVRANFWLALKLANLKAPDEYSEEQTLDSDEKIADKMGKNVNNIRVTRANGCKRIGDYDRMLEHLLKLLMKKSASGRPQRRGSDAQELVSVA